MKTISDEIRERWGRGYRLKSVAFRRKRDAERFARWLRRYDLPAEQWDTVVHCAPITTEIANLAFVRLGILPEHKEFL